MKTLICFIVLSVFAAVPSFATAANHYIRSDATGNGSGSDWTNAYSQFPSALARGDTYYIGDGVYGTYDFDDPESGNTYIYIKKATEADHGTDTGWHSSYGDGAATYTGTSTVWDFESSYWDVDGVTGSGESGHGFVLQLTGGANASYACQIDGSQHIILRHVEMYHPDPCGSGDVAQDGIRATGAPDNVTVAYCYIHDWKRNCIIAVGADNWMIEHSYLAASHSTSENHGQAIYMGFNAADGWTIRYNTFRDINGSAVVFFSGNCTNINIYGNLFWEKVESTGCGLYSVGSILGHNNSGGDVNGLRFYNNTMIDFDGRGASGNINLDSGSDNMVYNNIWYGCNMGSMAYTTHDYNACDCSVSETNGQSISSSVFSNYADGNFTLSESTDQGMTLPSPYNTDMFGNVRGQDGTWDRGAFEYNLSGNARPNAPQGLQIVENN